MGRRRLVTHAAGVALSGLALGAAGAVAATVTLYEGGNKTTTFHALFHGSAGERNELTLTSDRRGVTFADARVPVQAGRGCLQLDPNRVRCARGVPQAFLGDRDDRGVATVGFLDGGPGRDVLTGAHAGGGEGDDVLRGTAGNDTLGGGPGSDRLIGRAGDDSFAGGQASEADRIDGGPGNDEITYFDVPRVTIDLARGRGGARGEDRLASVESATASAGTYLGNERRNRLRAFEAAVMRGRAGSDVLVAESEARDDLDGGPGNDELHLVAFDRTLPARDRIRCGPGRDLVGNPSPNTLVPVDCERVSWPDEAGPGVALSRPGHPAGGLATVLWRGGCTYNDFAKPCELKAAVHEARWPDRSRRPAAGVSLGRARGAISSARPSLVLRPNRRGRRVLASGRCVIARLKVDILDTDGALEALFRIGERCRAP
jgi:hypothetical protein